MTSSFPLLNLPLDGILHVVKSMNYGEFISLSLLSERAKQVVKLMNLNHKTSSITITNHICIYMFVCKSLMEWKFTMNNDPEDPANGPWTDNVELRIYAPVRVELRMKGLSIKKWINHFKEIFHFSSFSNLRFMENANLFDIEELRIMFNSYEHLSISSNSESNVKSILKNFPTRCLAIMNDIFDLLEDPYPVLIQNYDQLVIRPESELASALKLDDLLITNSKTIDFNNLDWKEKDLNRFLKHWMKGSNPRMEMLQIHFVSPEALNKSDIFQGIKCMEMPFEHTRRFQTSVGKADLIGGGIDIYRKDGIKATINFSDDEFHGYMLEIDCTHSASDRPSPIFSFIRPHLFCPDDDSFPSLQPPSRSGSPCAQINGFWRIVSFLSTLAYKTHHFSITLSLLSERAKRSVGSMNWKYVCSIVHISSEIRLHIVLDTIRLDWTFKLRNGRASGHSLLPKKVKLRIFRNPPVNVKRSMKGGLSIKEWITHLKEVFHFSKFYCLKFDENTSRFDMKALRTLFCTYDKVDILSDNRSNVKSILKHFPTRRLLFADDVFKNLENPHQVLIQNYDDLEIRQVTRPSTLTLDDLLVINSKTIDISNIGWREKELNRFLKHWIKGSNPRMERLQIHFVSPEALNKSDIFKGINCTEFPAEHTRWFKSDIELTCTVKGGYDFNRCDGTKATIEFKSLDNLQYLNMNVHYLGEVDEIERRICLMLL
ncbi:hypothetical protein CRE_24773 [Caenorhabditis remanei]|uniref:F-box domain-containing protein n=1 Tax=Caenorhabditis remanei TaxID=31234 RepID=E3NCT8_CAERE|nr:hypothetical protein CRE_24773 [Caenorhabditis remanei]